MISRLRVLQITEAPRAGDAASRRFGVFILALIAANVLAVILQSVPELAARWETEFRAFEVFSVAVFSVEYLARVWSCVEDRGTGARCADGCATCSVHLH